MHDWLNELMRWNVIRKSDLTDFTYISMLVWYGNLSRCHEQSMYVHLLPTKCSVYA